MATQRKASTKSKATPNEEPTEMAEYFRFDELREGLTLVHQEFEKSIAGYKADPENKENFLPLIAATQLLKRAVVALGGGAHLAQAGVSLKIEKHTQLAGKVNPFRSGTQVKPKAKASANNTLRAITETPDASGKAPKVELSELDKIKGQVRVVLDTLADQTIETLTELDPVVIKSVAKNLKVEGYTEMNIEDVILKIAEKAEAALAQKLEAEDLAGGVGGAEVNGGLEPDKDEEKV